MCVHGVCLCVTPCTPNRPQGYAKVTSHVHGHQHKITPCTKVGEKRERGWPQVNLELCPATFRSQKGCFLFMKRTNTKFRERIEAFLLMRGGGNDRVKGFGRSNMCETRLFTQILAKTADNCAKRTFSHNFLVAAPPRKKGTANHEKRGWPQVKLTFWSASFLVWMTGLEPATSWSLTRCATNCATSRGPLVQKGLQISAFFSEKARMQGFISNFLGGPSGRT